VAAFADISNYQAGIDLSAYTASGADRLWILATDGATWPDPEFPGWWRQARSLGLHRGAYHYARPSLSAGATEADHFVSVVEAAGGADPRRDWVVLDTEDGAGTGSAAQHAVDFCGRMVQHGYSSGLIYSYSSYLADAGLTAAMLPPGWRRLHIANYGPVPDAVMPLPPGWTRTQVAARQYTDTARIPGVPAVCDASRIVTEWLALGELVLDDPTSQQIAAIFRGVLNEGTGAGQTAWAATERAILALEQTLFNAVEALVAALGWNPGDPSLAARSDAISAGLGQVAGQLTPAGGVLTALNTLGQQLATLVAEVKALPVSTAGGANLTPVLARLDGLSAALAGLTLVAKPAT